jgi:hypothetical protein
VNRVTGNIATSSTPPELISERSFIPRHSILHYVQKDDPRGTAPERPEDDPQYVVWEEAIQDWIRRMREENPNWELRFEDPPTSFDTPESLAFVPTVEVLSPSPSSTLTSRRIATSVRVSAVRGVARVLYRIDGRYIGAIESPPFDLDEYVPELANGDHLLTVIAEDTGGARRIVEIPFFLSAGEEPPSISWVERSLSLSDENFPRTLFMNHFRLEDIARIRILLKRPNDTSATTLATIETLSELFNNQILFRWEKVPESGTWELIAQTEQKNGTLSEDRVTVTIR